MRSAAEIKGLFCAYPGSFPAIRRFLLYTGMVAAAQRLILHESKMMKKPINAVNVFAITAGLFLSIEGAWGLASDVVFGVFTTNTLHAVIHLLLGVNAIYFGLRNRARKFIVFLGVLLLAVALLFFIPATNNFVVDLLNLNNAGATANIIIGAGALLFAVLTPKPAHNNNLK